MNQQHLLTFEEAIKHAAAAENVFIIFLEPVKGSDTPQMTTFGKGFVVPALLGILRFIADELEMKLKNKRPSGS